MKRGLPPLARREPSRSRFCARWRGSTSARAERTCAACSRTYAAQVYLRSRGENTAPEISAKIDAGLPPLARREPAARGAKELREGSTSARAERTRRGGGELEAAQVYLRSRGENEVVALAEVDNAGLPPLARREPPARSTWSSRTWSTSARAERTQLGATYMSGLEVYLRSRGENSTIPAPSVCSAGLPPLARRERTRALPALSHRRSTSARAERTRQRDGAELGWRVYLRSRGENANPWSHRCGSEGLPPLARREHARDGRGPAGQRSTSARAERTASRPESRHSSRVYLRSRGENSVWQAR